MRRLLLFLLPLLCTPVAKLHAAGLFDFAGSWAGWYDCRQGRTALELDVSVTGPESLQALFYFHAVSSNPRVPAGCFLMAGKVDPVNAALALHPTAWLLRPVGFVPVGLHGMLNQNQLQGFISGPGCSDFLLTRQPAPAAPAPCTPPQGLFQS